MRFWRTLITFFPLPVIQACTGQILKCVSILTFFILQKRPNSSGPFVSNKHAFVISVSKAFRQFEEEFGDFEKLVKINSRSFTMKAPARQLNCHCFGINYFWYKTFVIRWKFESYLSVISIELSTLSTGVSTLITPTFDKANNRCCLYIRSIMYWRYPLQLWTPPNELMVMMAISNSNENPPQYRMNDIP